MTTLRVLAAVLSAATIASADPIKVLMIDGYGNHDWRRTTRLVRGIVEPTGLFAVTVSTAPATTNDPAYSTWRPDFARCEVVIQTCNDLGGRGPLWPAPVREAFERFVATGGGAFILHSANNAFADWPAYNRMIGLGWRNKDFGWAVRVQGDESLERIPPGQGGGTSHGARTDRLIHRLGDHPIHAGLPRQWMTPLIEVYTFARGPAENLSVLSWGEDPKTRERWPTEWAVEYGKGRTYSSSFGHVWADEADPVDMRCADFQTLLVRALEWLAHRPVTASLPADFPGVDRPSLRPLATP